MGGARDEGRGTGAGMPHRGPEMASDFALPPDLGLPAGKASGSAGGLCSYRLSVDHTLCSWAARHSLKDNVGNPCPIYHNHLFCYSHSVSTELANRKHCSLEKYTGSCAISCI